MMAPLPQTRFVLAAMVVTRLRRLEFLSHECPIEVLLNVVIASGSAPLGLLPFSLSRCLASTFLFSA